MIHRLRKSVETCRKKQAQSIRNFSGVIDEASVPEHNCRQCKKLMSKAKGHVILSFLNLSASARPYIGSASTSIALHIGYVIGLWGGRYCQDRHVRVSAVPQRCGSVTSHSSYFIGVRPRQRCLLPFECNFRNQAVGAAGGRVLATLFYPFNCSHRKWFLIFAGVPCEA